MGKYSDASPFVEGQAIIAAQERDDEELRKILEQMLPGEKWRLSQAANYLFQAIRRGT